MKLKTLSPLITVVMLPLAGYLGWRALRDYSFAEIVAAVTEIPGHDLSLAVLFTACSYLCLTGFDTLAIRYLGHTLPYPKIALTSFIALSIGHNVGVAALSSGALRYRFYSSWGLSAADVGKIILFCGVTVALGLITLGGLALLLEPTLAAGFIGLDRPVLMTAGGVCLALSLLYVVLAWRIREPLRIRRFELRFPPVWMAAAQIGIGTVDFAFVAAALHRLFASAEISYLETVTAYVVANVAALLSHVPGGLGVLEYVILSLVGGAKAVGALIAFRIVYYFLPLMLGGLLLGASEIVRWSGKTS